MMAFELIHDIDLKDLLFVALAIQYNCKLWTGDKKLIKGLRNKGFDQVIDTSELRRTT